MLLFHATISEETAAPRWATEAAARMHRAAGRQETAEVAAGAPEESPEVQPRSRASGVPR